MTGDEELLWALEMIRPWWTCPSCGCASVSIVTDPVSGEAIPDTGHHAAPGDPARSCPVLSGGSAAAWCYVSLWEAIAAYIAVADYPAESWASAEVPA